MTHLIRKVRRFFRSDDGPSAVEYAVMIALIVVICLASIRTIGRQGNKSFNTVRTSLRKAVR